MVKLEVKILDERVRSLPLQYATEGSAAMDLRAVIDKPLILNPGRVELISSGLSIHVKDPGYAAFVMPRSGLGHKEGVVLGNTIGLIDSDYTGPLMLSILNRNRNKIITINPLDRVAQLLVLPIQRVDITVVDEFDETKRGSGGFGSTGTS